MDQRLGLGRSLGAVARLCSLCTGITARRQFAATASAKEDRLDVAFHATLKQRLEPTGSIIPTRRSAYLKNGDRSCGVPWFVLTKAMERMVLVTGATGTIGRDVAKLLSKNG